MSGAERKTALVTGGAEGIGACIATTLGKAGYSVIFCDLNDDKGQKRESILRKGGIDANFIHCDVSDPDSISRMSDTLGKTHNHLNVVVNNAGISDPSMKFPAEDLGQWKKVIETNLSSMYYVANSFVDMMPKSSSIVNIASTRAYQSEKNTLAYSASKGGVVALTHSLSVTLSERRIRVNCISPGWIDTSEWRIPPVESDLKRIDHLQHPSGRVGVPEDIARMVQFLSIPQGDWVNGQNITIDGGMTKRMIYFDDDVLKEIKEKS